MDLLYISIPVPKGVETLFVEREFILCDWFQDLDAHTQETDKKK